MTDAQTPRQVDAVTVSITWNALLSITEEMGTALRNAAFSAAVREGDDFSTALFDREGRLIAQGNFAPGQLGSMPYVLQHILAAYPPHELKPGDGILLNDSALGSGHFPDVYLVSPVFADEGLIGYAASIAHQVDVGGAAAGSQMVRGVSEAFQEGIRILPLKAVQNDRFDEGILRLILGNVRLPDIVKGDLFAQLNANQIGKRQLQALYERQGFAVMSDAIENILSRSESAMRERIRDMPDGIYSFTDHIDDFGPGTPAIRVSVKVTIKESDIELDFSDSSDQVPAALNCYLNYTRAYCFFAIRIFTGINVPQNSGAVRPITVKAREGSFFNPTFPAASGGRAIIQVRIFEAINGALAPICRDKAVAAFSHWSNPNIGGIDDRTGESFVYYDLIMGGYGAASNADGTEALASVMNCANIPIEMHELVAPVRIRCLELIPGSGGKGRFRGGCGVRKDIELLTSKARATLLGDRHTHAPYGLEGGEAGSLGETILIRDGNSTSLSSKDVVDLQRGDILSFRLSGGGGFGDPAARSPEDRERDITSGLERERRPAL